VNFVCFLWQGRAFERPVARYGVEHVAVLASMLQRHGGHRLTCVHDGVDLPPGVDGIRLPEAVAALPDYLPKLWAWSPALHAHFTERMTFIDLDVVILGDLAPALRTAAPVRLWDSARDEPYNTSLFTIDPGYGQRVWTKMTPAAVDYAKSITARWTGDQSWVAHVLGPDYPTFGEDTGIVRYRRSLHAEVPPPGTRAAFLCGPMAPDTERSQCKWIKEQWN
jgi:hypothetical protein